MKPTKTEITKTAIEEAGFTMRAAGRSPFLVELVRMSDGRSFGRVHRFQLTCWLRGERLVDARGKVVPPVAEAKVAA